MTPWAALAHQSAEVLRTMADPKGPEVARVLTPDPAKGKFIAIVDGKEMPAPEIAMGDAATLRRIIDEGLNRNQVMEHLRHLTQVIGPRLTGSARAKVANEWTRDQFRAWGLKAEVEQWGTIGMGFDRGPSTGRVMIARTEEKDGKKETNWETSRELQLTTLSWTPGTDGPTRGRVVKLPKSDEEYAKVRGSLKGAWVLIDPPPPVGQRGVRARNGAAYEARKDARKKVAEGADPQTLPIAERVIFDGVLGFISTSRDERVWTGAPPGWRNLTPETLGKDVAAIVRLSDYDFINSRLADGEAFEVELNLANRFVPGPVGAFNTIAEIRGTERPDEVVFVTAHLDSWDGPGAQGSLDNGTGSASVMEAARLLMAAGAKPKRTIRFCLWTGEEQGLLGARAYVKQHVDQKDKWSMNVNDDGGTNWLGGMPAAEQMVPMLAAATAPLNYVFYSQADQKWMNVEIRSTGPRIRTHASSDHHAFNEVGVPGFFWDEKGRQDYGYGWHTQNDRYELAIPEYLMQSATAAAVTAYQIACAPTLLPRSLPEEKSPEGGEKASPTPASTPTRERTSAPAPATPVPVTPAPAGRGAGK
jgi:carboxypeptidase Q